MAGAAKTGGSGRVATPWTFKAGLALAALGLLAVLYVVSASLSKPEDGGYKRFAKGPLRELVVLRDPPPQSSRPFTTADGFETKLQNFRGKVVVLNLWATWCAPCIEEMPTLAALQAAYKDRDLVVVPVSLDTRAKRDRAIKDLAELSQGRLGFYADPTAAVAFDSRAGEGMPITIIYSRDGRELARYAGAANWNSPEAHALFEAALADGAPTPPQPPRS